MATFSGITGKGDFESSSLNSLKLNSRLSDKSWLVEEGDEEDPFAAIDEVGENDELDPEAARVRDQHARLTAVLKDLIDELQPSLPDFTLRDVCDQLVSFSLDLTDLEVVALTVAFFFFPYPAQHHHRRAGDAVSVCRPPRHARHS